MGVVHGGLPSSISFPSVNGMPMATVIWALRGRPCRPKRFAKASATKPPRMDPKVAITWWMGWMAWPFRSMSGDTKIIKNIWYTSRMMMFWTMALPYEEIWRNDYIYFGHVLSSSDILSCDSNVGKPKRDRESLVLFRAGIRGSRLHPSAMQLWSHNSPAASKFWGVSAKCQIVWTMKGRNYQARVVKIPTSQFCLTCLQDYTVYKLLQPRNLLTIYKLRKLWSKSPRGCELRGQDRCLPIWKTTKLEKQQVISWHCGLSSHTFCKTYVLFAQASTRGCS